MTKVRLNHLRVGSMFALLCGCTQATGPWPDVAQEQYRISLSRNGCLGTCPNYKVTIEGNGQVTFVGREFVNFVGTKIYTVPKAEVSALIHDIQRYDILKAEDDYGAPVDAPVCTINIDAGSHRKDVLSVCGTPPNVPSGVIKLHARIDEVARTAEFNLTPHSMEQAKLLAGRFDIKLERTECYGTCPSYSVSVNQYGEVEFIGRKYVNFIGTKRYAIPKNDAVALAQNFMRLHDQGVKGEYLNRVTDMPTYRISMKVDNVTHTIVDYDGYQVGMPTSVSELQIRIDDVTRSVQFLNGPPFEVPTGPRCCSRQPMDVTVVK
jgi:hypothetical protein